MEFTNKEVLVNRGSGGIGRACAIDEYSSLIRSGFVWNMLIHPIGRAHDGVRKEVQIHDRVTRGPAENRPDEVYRMPPSGENPVIGAESAPAEAAEIAVQ